MAAFLSGMTSPSFPREFFSRSLSSSWTDFVGLGLGKKSGILGQELSRGSLPSKKIQISVVGAEAKKSGALLLAFVPLILPRGQLGWV